MLNQITNKDELKALLKNMKVLYSLKKNLWKRWFALFHNMIDKKNNFVVEYFWSVDKNLVIEKALIVYKNAFKVTPWKEEIKLKENNNLKWWIRVIMDDKMIDISYSNIEEKIRSGFLFD